jgi:hypothetical protein
MVFSDTSGKSGLLQMCEQTTNLGDGIITGNTVLKAYFTNLINQWYRIAAYFAWKVDKNWTFDDSNITTLPNPTTTLVNGQRDYALPSTALRIRQVEILDTTGTYFTLSFMSEADGRLRNDKEGEDAGIPSHYRLFDNSLILYPAPDTSKVTAAAGLRVTIDREVDSFVVGDTTQEPGLNAAFQGMLYYGPCFEWATKNNIAPVATLCSRMLGNFTGLTEMLQEFYGSRNQDTLIAISPVQKSYK